MFKTSLFYFCSAFKIQGFVFESYYQLRSFILGLLFGCFPWSLSHSQLSYLYCELPPWFIWNGHLLNIAHWASSETLFWFLSRSSSTFLHFGSEEWCSLEASTFLVFFFFHTSCNPLGIYTHQDQCFHPPCSMAFVVKITTCLRKTIWWELER